MSVRVRLALSYAGLVVVCGLAFLVISLSVLKFVPDGNLAAEGLPFIPNRSDLLEVFWPRIVVGTGMLTVAGVIFGWFLAGHMLRPLQPIHAVAEQVAGGSLTPRVRLSGPPDEFRVLADGFDGMLDRVEADLEEQRRFAANASHELRTPYAISRTLLDIALADPEGRDIDHILSRLDETNRRGLDVVEALLALSSFDRGVELPRLPVDLTEEARSVLADVQYLAESTGITIDGTLGEGDFDGYPTLVRQLVWNLVLNSVRHNVGPGGTVALRTGATDDGHVELQVANTGPVVPPELLPTLTEPFVRGAGRVAADPGRPFGGRRGSGLGLAIVARVADAHGADLRIAAPPTGGLDVLVRFRGL